MTIQEQKMSGKEKRRILVQELLFAGYTQEKIAQKLNISVRTVAREVKKIRDSSKTWMNDLAKNNFVHMYRESLEGFRQDIMYLKEMLEEESTKSDPHLRLEIIKHITFQRYKHAEFLHKGPVVWSIENLVRKCIPEPIKTPKMPAIYENQ